MTSLFLCTWMEYKILTFYSFAWFRLSEHSVLLLHLTVSCIAHIMCGLFHAAQIVNFQMSMLDIQWVTNSINGTQTRHIVFLSKGWAHFKRVLTLKKSMRVYDIWPTWSLCGPIGKIWFFITFFDEPEERWVIITHFQIQRWPLFRWSFLLFLDLSFSVRKRNDVVWLAVGLLTFSFFFTHLFLILWGLFMSDSSARSWRYVSYCMFMNVLWSWIHFSRRSLWMYIYQCRLVAIMLTSNVFSWQVGSQRIIILCAKILLKLWKSLVCTCNKDVLLLGGSRDA